MKSINTTLHYYRFTQEMHTRMVHYKIRGTARDVFDHLCLQQKSYQSGKVQALSIESIAEACNCDVRSVQRALHKLTNAGLYLPEKWGKITGSLPQNQLANHAIDAKRNEKRHKTFYQELKNRMDKQRNITPRTVGVAFEKLCIEKAKAKQFHPDLGGGATADTILKEMSKYLEIPSHWNE